MTISWVTPELILNTLAVIWGLIVLTVAATALMHGLRVLRKRGYALHDQRARPLVARFALADETDEPDPALRETLRQARGSFGARVDQRLATVLESVRGESRDRLAALLVERGHADRLRRRARSRRTVVRAGALRRLGKLGLPEDAETVRAGTSSSRPIVQSVAARALASYPSAESVQAVLALLRGTGEVPTLVTVSALIGMGGRDGESLQSIRDGLEDSSPRVRAACAQALGELTSTADADRIGRLLTTDPTPGVQLAAASALERIGRSSSVPALLHGARSAWGPVRLHSAQALLALPAEVRGDALAELARTADPLLATVLQAHLDPTGS